MLISERADFNERFFMNQRHSVPQLRPPRPESLIEPSPPSIHLPDAFEDILDDPGRSQMPVHGGDVPLASEQSSVHSQSVPGVIT